jgi:hypothetical protein
MKSKLFIQFMTGLALGFLSLTSAYALDPIKAEVDNKSTVVLPTLPTSQSGQYVLSYDADTNSLKWRPEYSSVNNISAVTTGSPIKTTIGSSVEKTETIVTKYKAIPIVADIASAALVVNHSSIDG